MIPETAEEKRTSNFRQIQQLERESLQAFLSPPSLNLSQYRSQ